MGGSVWGVLTVSRRSRGRDHGTQRCGGGARAPMSNWCRPSRWFPPNSRGRTTGDAVRLPATTQRSCVAAELDSVSAVHQRLLPGEIRNPRRRWESLELPAEAKRLHEQVAALEFFSPPPPERGNGGQGSTTKALRSNPQGLEHRGEGSWRGATGSRYIPPNRWFEWNTTRHARSRDRARGDRLIWLESTMFGSWEEIPPVRPTYWWRRARILWSSAEEICMAANLNKPSWRNDMAEDRAKPWMPAAPSLSRHGICCELGDKPDRWAPRHGDWRRASVDGLGDCPMGPKCHWCRVMARLSGFGLRGGVGPVLET
jgi:hypothetical protein